MDLIDRLAEQHITEAVERGDLDNLSGAGKPLELDDLSSVPEHLRSGYKLLRNAGFLPPELHTRREIAEVADLLDSISETDHATRDYAQRKLDLLYARLENQRSRHNSPMWAQDPEYTALLMRHLERGSNKTEL
ncbi:DnaJ family domain-containing protein [Halorhodospira halochloris]|uniref:DnaJ family domain-containing protein n=1 Tax=Halorhodospira halochloris TaxID=1052 RepID=UPI001EE80471|nr:DnaJ family domain-containing protein [Halorhodospira halochloris]MCG5548722.1 DUF1992 domain-containing protein [Halorhodospira halochloris]